MNWKDVGSLVGQAAPILGTLIGGPAGAAIGGMVASVLGTANTPDAISAAIATDPDASLKLRAMEMDNKVKLEAMVYEHAANEMAADTARIQADVEDRKSAREREVAVRDSTPKILAYLIVISSIALGVSVVTGFVTKDPILAGTVGTVLGYVFSESKQVLSYYFGSSSGSAEKTRLLGKATPAAEPNAVTGP